MLPAALTTHSARHLLHAVAVIIREVPMDISIKTAVMMATIGAEMMVIIGIAMMVAIDALSVVMMMAIGAKCAVMVIIVVGLVKAKGVVLHKAVVVEAAPLPPTRMWSARFAKSMVTPPTNVGGATLTEMIEMVILVLRRRERME
jgi:hypothetical protein